ncbi:MAG: alpha/beta fold hydrolase [Planctomycetota bacterium]
MTEFVLVHGSGQNARSWARVAAILRLRGHRVVTPELVKDDGALGLEHHAAAITDHLTTHRAVLVAHSLCGVFVPLVAARSKIARMVFVAAVIPEPGRSVREQFAADAGMFHAQWIAAGARWRDPVQREALARDFLFHDAAAATLPFALATMEPMDTRAVVVEPCPLDALPRVPSTVIVAARDRTLTADWCAGAARRLLHVEPHLVDSGHCPQVVRPVLVADLLERAATED